MTRDTRIPLTKESIGEISNWGERVFAEACLGRDNLDVVCQVPVGGSVIDFQVTRTDTGTTRLVEVTSTRRKHVKKTGRKSRQIRAMKKSGLPHSLLTGENLTRIQRCNKRRKR